MRKISFFKVFKILNLINTGFIIIIFLLGIFYAPIAFGMGLGDLFGFILLLIYMILLIVTTFLRKKRISIIDPILFFVFSYITVMFCLYATIWRGPNYPWNGNFFYQACLRTIEIDNFGDKREVEVTMCSMDYDSKFDGYWDGERVAIQSGKINIPEKLKKWTNKNFNEVYIQPCFFTDGTTKSFRFAIDTLNQTTLYHLRGEVISIKDKLPVMEVIILDEN